METKMLAEGLEKGTLKRLIRDEIHIDEFKSKLGRDADVVVATFKVCGKEPALDLVNFIEKGYSWVIDADVSSGEMDDGDYVVFVECERNQDIANNLVSMSRDLCNLADKEMSAWRVRYYTDQNDFKMTVSDMKKIIPDTPEKYEKKYGQRDLDHLKAIAGVKVDTKAPKNDYTESLRRAAGLI